MIKPNLNIVSDHIVVEENRTKKYVIVDNNHEEQQAGNISENCKFYRNDYGDVCCAVPGLTDAEKKALHNYYDSISSISQTGGSILGYKRYEDTDGMTTFIFTCHKDFASLRELAQRKHQFKSLELLYKIFLELLRYPAVSLSLDSVFYDTETERVWLLPVSASATSSEQELMLKAADIAVKAENHAQEEAIKSYHEIIQKCLEHYPARRFKTIEEACEAIVAALADQLPEECEPENEPTFADELKTLFHKLKGIQLPKIHLPQLEEKETSGQVADTYVPSNPNRFPRLPKSNR